MSADAVSYKVLIAKSRDIPFYNAVDQAFRRGLASRGFSSNKNLDFTTVSLSGDANKDDAQLRSALARSPALVFTLGTDATTQIAGLHPGAPVLFGMILDPVALGLAASDQSPGGSFTGTTLVVSPGKQFDALIQVMPQVHTIGVIYTDKDPTSLRLLASAQTEARDMNLVVNAQSVSSSEAIDGALQKFSRGVDAIWLIPDPNSTGPDALAETIKFANQHRLPVLGSSSASVHAGALVALSANLDDLGDLSAEMAIPLMEGNSQASSTSVRGPRQTLLSINLKVARTLNITVPESILHLADEVVDDGGSK